MKKNLLIAVLAAAGIMSTAGALAADGQINFVGTITDTSCTVTNDPSNPLTVTLGTVSKNAFTGTGSTAAPTKFAIELTDCPITATSAVVKFDGTSANSDNSALKLTQDVDVATGVGIQLSDATGAVVPLYTASNLYNLSEGTNQLDFVARYLALADTVTAGSANSTSQFTIIYN
ncbi:Type-1A pilin [Morganella morganii]|uniref:fimbrial protein n=1 Tax=Morganella morganii TaxID=582 RepID=UPI000D990F77|nr:fimbrial protein [Morganella morganii]SPX81834.1 Type-1A pilin [Morganella morganii]